MNLTRRQLILQVSVLSLLALLLLPFAFYAIDFGRNGLSGSLAEPHYIDASQQPEKSGVYIHMLLGGLITVLAPFQLVTQLRHALPKFHRVAGRLICIGACVSAVGGLGYIWLHGTIGGPAMDIGFTLYGILMIASSVQAFRHARARRITQHQAWALRLFWLVLGSWLYRVHYGLWYLLTGGAWSTSEFSGGFDLVQNFAFYLPYLFGVELYLVWKRSKGRVGQRPAGT